MSIRGFFAALIVAVALWPRCAAAHQAPSGQSVQAIHDQSAAQADAPPAAALVDEPLAANLDGGASKRASHRHRRRRHTDRDISAARRHSRSQDESVSSAQDGDASDAPQPTHARSQRHEAAAPTIQHVAPHAAIHTSAMIAGSMASTGHPVAGALPSGARPIAGGAAAAPTRVGAAVKGRAATGLYGQPAGAHTVDDIESRPITDLSSHESAVKSARQESPGTMIWNVLTNLVLVLALAGACGMAWKRLKGGNPVVAAAPAEGIRVCSTVALAPQRFLHLVTVGDRRLLIGSSSQQVSLIADLQTPTREPESAVVGTALPLSDVDDRFQQLLARLEAQSDATAPAAAAPAAALPATRTAKAKKRPAPFGYDTAAQEPVAEAPSTRSHRESEGAAPAARTGLFRSAPDAQSSTRA